MSKKSCVVLVSGGLDSRLALKMMVEQGLRTIAFHATQVFANRIPVDEEIQNLRQACLDIGADEVIFRSTSEGMVDLTKEPRYGYGKNLNACLDCRLLTIRTAKTVMDEVGADFLASGEVLGQRPKSQLKQGLSVINRAIREMGIEGLLLRPLCAKCLEPSIPETEGWVDREALENISGRGRHRQMEMAAQWNIPYPNPAGGCLLTDAHYCARLKDVMQNDEAWSIENAEWIKFGRQFRLGATRFCVSRSEGEETRLFAIAKPGDRFFQSADKPGALILVRGALSEEAQAFATGLAIRYGKCREDGVGAIATWAPGEEPTTLPDCKALPDEKYTNHMIG